jgi:hypothetical protein
VIHAVTGSREPFADSGCATSSREPMSLPKLVAALASSSADEQVRSASATRRGGSGCKLRGPTGLPCMTRWSTVFGSPQRSDRATMWLLVDD